VAGGVGLDWVYYVDSGNVSLDAGANGIEVVLTLGGNDTINAATQTANFSTYAGAGNDTVTGGSGNDNIYGQDGNDVIVGGNGNDLIWGEGGVDSLTGGNGDDTLIADSLDTLVSGGSGIDWVYYIDNGNVTLDAGANGIEVVLTLGGSDTINAATQTANFAAYAGAGNDTITGGSGNDGLFGQDGNDVIVGGSGDDVLLGEAGDDILTGGAGGDVLAGGSGIDTFRFLTGWGSDAILDFQNGIDRIDMSGLAGSGVLSMSDLIIGTSGADATILWNGNYIVLNNAAGQLDASDFIFGGGG
jgi:Ca2+-binding RTX toxin-like protein